MKAKKNVFAKSKGVNAYAQIIKMKKETAMEQLLEILAILDQNNHGPITMEFIDFTDEECLEFDKKMLEMIALRSQLRGHAYHIDFQPSVYATR